MTVSPRRLSLRRCAYWLSLRLLRLSAVQQRNVTVHVPEANVFDVEALQDLMEMSRAGELR